MQRQLAYGVGLVTSYLGQLVRGQRRAALGVVQRVCERLGATAADLRTPSSAQAVLRER